MVRMLLWQISLSTTRACASCCAWLHQDQVQIHQWHLLTQRQTSSCQSCQPPRCWPSSTEMPTDGASWSLSVGRRQSFAFAHVSSFCGRTNGSVASRQMSDTVKRIYLGLSGTTGLRVAVFTILKTGMLQYSTIWLTSTVFSEDHLAFGFHWQPPSADVHSYPRCHASPWSVKWERTAVQSVKHSFWQFGIKLVTVLAGVWLENQWYAQSVANGCMLL